jgi:hypothetical protein
MHEYRGLAIIAQKHCLFLPDGGKLLPACGARLRRFPVFKAFSDTVVTGRYSQHHIPGWRIDHHLREGANVFCAIAPILRLFFGRYSHNAPIPCTMRMVVRERAGEKSQTATPLKVP